MRAYCVFNQPLHLATSPHAVGQWPWADPDGKLKPGERRSPVCTWTISVYVPSWGLRFFDSTLSKYEDTKKCHDSNLLSGDFLWNFHPGPEASRSLDLLQVGITDYDKGRQQRQPGFACLSCIPGRRKPSEKRCLFAFTWRPKCSNCQGGQVQAAADLPPFSSSPPVSGGADPLAQVLRRGLVQGVILYCTHSPQLRARSRSCIWYPQKPFKISSSFYLI